MLSQVSPKKKSLMPSSPLRSQLRGAGHALPAIVQIGKEGTTAAVLKQLGQALHDHELVKVKIGSECPETRFETADQLAALPDVQLAQVLGRTLLVYRRDPERLRYEGGAAPPRAAAPAAGASRKAAPTGKPRPAGGTSRKAAPTRAGQPSRATSRRRSASSPRR
jgi:RNA-binding protein